MYDRVTSSGRFAIGVAPWRDRIGLARDAVRQELVRRQLADHLPQRPGRALDVGCGQGTQAIALARAGWSVVGVDPENSLLDVAQSTLRAESAEVQSRTEFRVGDLFELAASASERFDIVCCHGVVMYLPSLRDAVAALADVVAPEGVLSVLSRNRAGIAMRAGMTGDWQGALDGFEARTYGNRLGIRDVRADDPDDVAEAFRDAGVEPTAWYGVRLFTDHWGDVDPPDELDGVMEAEDQAGRRDPYRRVAALTHTIGRRSVRAW